MSALQTPAPSAPPPTPASSVEIGLDGLHLGGTGRAPSLLPSDDVTGTLAALRALLGEPTIATSQPGDHCVVAATTYDWHGALVLSVVEGDATYDMRILEASVASPAGVQVPLTGPDGIHVGDDIASRITTTPEDRKESYEADGRVDWTVLLDAGRTSKDPAQGLVGTAAFSRGTIVTAIGAPVAVHSNQDC